MSALDGDRTFVHESSFVDEGVSIGEGTRVWHFCHLLRNTVVGRDCTLGQNVTAGPNVTIGDNVKVQNNVSIYEGVVLEDDVFCGPSAVFTNVMTPRAHVARKSEFLPTLVRRGASLGANCTILCGITIGEYAMIGAGAVVTRDVEPHALLTGNPARRRGWVCACGEKLAFAADSASCLRCGSRYALRNGRCEPAGA